MRGTVSCLRVLRCQEDNISNHHEWCRAQHNYYPLVENGADVREYHDRECSNDVRWNGVELQLDHRCIGINSRNDCWREECQAIDGDVVEEENKCC